MRIGIYGGTFSPPTIAHIQIAVNAINKLTLDNLIIIPNGNPPHKIGIEKNIDNLHRFNMTELAFKDIEKVFVSDIEMQTDSLNYTFNTLTKLHRQYKEDELYFIMGADSLQEFQLWHNPIGICNLSTLAVFERKGINLQNLIKQIIKNYKAKIILINEPIEDVSSTYVRLCIGVIGSSNYIPKQVSQYINTHKLYKLDNNMSNITKYLDDKRIFHSINAAVIGCKLAKQLHIDENSVITACLLHDVCKLDISDKYNMYPQPVRHAFASADIAHDVFGINDNDILDAIRYHTTGRPDMTLLGKIVYVADEIEDGRNKPDLQQLCLNDFQEGFMQCLKDSYEYTVKKYGKEKMHHLTQDTINFYGGNI